MDLLPVPPSRILLVQILTCRWFSSPCSAFANSPFIVGLFVVQLIVRVVFAFGIRWSRRPRLISITGLSHSCAAWGCKRRVRTNWLDRSTLKESSPWPCSPTTTTTTSDEWAWWGKLTSEGNLDFITGNAKQVSMNLSGPQYIHHSYLGNLVQISSQTLLQNHFTGCGLN